MIKLGKRKLFGGSGNQHPVNVRAISRVRALMLDKAQLQDSEAMVLEQTQQAMIQSELVMPPGESHDQ
jgi:hypothetical protein